MVVKKTLSNKIFDVFNILLLSSLGLLTLYPFWHILVASFSDPAEIMLHRGLLFKPLGISTTAYRTVLENPAIYTGYRNTIFYVLVGTGINILMTTLGAYVISRKNFFWKKPINIMILITMFFHGGMIPSYLLVKSLGLLNSVWAVLLPTAISTWNLFIMRTAFYGIPDSLEEAAKIDGANDICILFRIIVPLIIPTMMVMVLFYAVSHWNAWFNAMLYLNRRKDLHPLQLFLREILIANSTQNLMETSGAEVEDISQTIKYATIMVSTLPIIFVYPFVQKYFVKGVMIGAIKE